MKNHWQKWLVLSALLVFLGAFNGEEIPGRSTGSGVYFFFKQQKFALQYPLKREKRSYRQNRAGLTNAALDTMSNWYSRSGRYVEIIRQDDPFDPHYGIALGFEFDDAGAAYPYIPTTAKLQFKDFSWGGVEFSRRDSCNFTGVSDAVSDDLTVFVDGFQNDTIFGRFYGVLLSGAGTMIPIDSGAFRVFVYQVE